MNKWIVLLSTGLAALAFTACDKKDDTTPATPAAAQQAPSVESSTNQGALPASVATEAAPAPAQK